MSKFALELLSRNHDRKAFHSGLDSIDQFLKQTARSQTEKGISVTRVLTPGDSILPKSILGFFTLTQISVEAKTWQGAKGLRATPVPAILLSRMGVDQIRQGQGLNRLLVATACKLALDAIDASGGIGLVVDAAHPGILPFYQKFGFVAVDKLRLFLPAVSLRVAL